MEIIFKTSFYFVVLLFWLTFFHGIRQTNRSISKFYLPKILMTGSLWISVTYVTCWSSISKLEKPTLDEISSFNQSDLLKFSSFLFYLSLTCFTLYLMILMLAAFTELRSMPYFDQRIKIQSFLLSFSLTISVLIVLINHPAPASISTASGSSYSGLEDQNDITIISFLQMLPWTYESTSSASFLTLYSVCNLYVYFCSYYYYPSNSSLVGKSCGHNL